MKKITLYSEDIRVIKRDWIYATVRDIWEMNPDAVSDEMVGELYGKLKLLTNVDEAIKVAHIENIEKRSMVIASRKDTKSKMIILGKKDTKSMTRIHSRKDRKSMRWLK